jgi:hypothetical protein
MCDHFTALNHSLRLSRTAAKALARTRALHFRQRGIHRIWHQRFPGATLAFANTP